MVKRRRSGGGGIFLHCASWLQKQSWLQGSIQSSWATGDSLVGSVVFPPSIYWGPTFIESAQRGLVNLPIANEELSCAIWKVCVGSLSLSLSLVTNSNFLGSPGARFQVSYWRKKHFDFNLKHIFSNPSSDGMCGCGLSLSLWWLWEGVRKKHFKDLVLNSRPHPPTPTI